MKPTEYAALSAASAQLENCIALLQRIHSGDMPPRSAIFWAIADATDAREWVEDELWFEDQERQSRLFLIS